MVSNLNKNDPNHMSSSPRIASALKFWLGMVVVAFIFLAYFFSSKPGRMVRQNLDPAGFVTEPSGLTWLAERGTLVVVGDEGQVAELTLEGDLVREKQLGGDFEGVTADPDNEVLYVVDEKQLEVLVLDWTTFEEKGRLDLRPILEEAGLTFNQSDSFEGLAYQPATNGSRPGMLWLGHQYGPVAILCAEVAGSPPELGFVGMWNVETKEISALCIDPADLNLIAVSDGENLLVELSPQGEILESRAIGGTEQEGIAVLPDGSYCIADDLGGVFHYSDKTVK